MEGNDLIRWLTLKKGAALGHLWASQDRDEYPRSIGNLSRRAHRRSFVEWSAYSADKTVTAMFYMGITEKDQYYS